jgi:hypothetical protein
VEVNDSGVPLAVPGVVRNQGLQLEVTGGVEDLPRVRGHIERID